MTPVVLQQKLLHLSREQKLGHFYVLSGRGTHDSDVQEKWVTEFIRQYWESIEKRTLPKELRHDADLLWLTPPIDEDDIVRDYKVEDLGELFSFLGYRGINSKRRFVIIEEGQRLSKILANKLLKTLEEPEGLVTFFWLNPMGLKLLPTIESRAINLALSVPQVTQSTPLLDELRQNIESGQTLSQFLDATKKTVSVDELLVELLNFEQRHDGPAELKQELLSMTQTWQKARAFNQSSNTTMQWIHTYLSQRFRTGR